MSARNFQPHHQWGFWDIFTRGLSNTMRGKSCTPPANPCFVSVQNVEASNRQQTTQP
jgi:hypothetical protein